MPSLAQYESALRNAHMAGDEEAARAIAQAYQQELTTRMNPPPIDRSADTQSGSVLGGIAENALALGSRAALTIPAGIAGTARSVYGSMTGETPDQADTAGGQMVRDVLSFGYDPKTDQGKAIQAGIAAPFEQGGAAALKYGGPKGKLAFDLASQLAPVGKVFGGKAVSAATKADETAALLKTVDKNVPLESQINQASNDLVTNLGGQSSKVQYDAQLKKQQNDQIDAIKTQETPLYDQVRSAVGSSKPVVPSSVIQYLDNRINGPNGTGGNLTALSPGERTLKKFVEENPAFVSVNGQTQPIVTYGALDSLRRQFGKKYKSESDFSTADTAQRDAIYAALSNDQMEAAKAAGVDNTLAQAHDLTIQRKALERSHTELYGNQDAFGSAIPKIDAAARGLQTGDMSKYEDFMSHVGDRKQGAIQVLQALMHPGGAGIGPKVIEVLQGMDPYARKQFITDLPPSALSRAEAISNAAATPLPKSGNIVGEAYQQVKQRTLPAVAAEAIGSMAGAPGLATSAIGGAALLKARKVRHDAMLATAKAKLAAKK
jgi:hypothetical protein